MDVDAHRGLPGKLVEGGPHAAAGGVAQHVHRRCNIQDLLHHVVQGSGIAAYIGIETQPFPLGQDGDPMVGHGAGENDPVARAGALAAYGDAFGNHADARRIDENLVGGAFGDDLGVTGDQLHAGLVQRLAHALQNTLKIGDGKAFLQDKAHAQVAGHCPAHGHVVDSAVDGLCIISSEYLRNGTILKLRFLLPGSQVNVNTAGKENGVHHEGVG